LKEAESTFTHDIPEEEMGAIMPKLNGKEFEIKLWKWGFCGTTEIDVNKFRMQQFATKNQFERKTSLAGQKRRVKLEIYKATKTVE